MLWIKDVDVANSVGDLMTSQSIGWYVFPDFEMRDAKNASALKRIMSERYFIKRIYVEEEHAQNTTDFWEGILLTLSMTIFEQPALALMMQLKTHQIYSMSLQKVMTSKILKQDENKLNYLQVKYPRKMSWTVCTRCEYVSLFSFRPYRWCMTKKLIEIKQCQAVED